MNFRDTHRVEGEYWAAVRWGLEAAGPLNVCGAGSTVSQVRLYQVWVLKLSITAKRTRTETVQLLNR